VRIVLAVFLVLAGCGYLSALVQVHYQSASPEELLPGPDRVRAIYAGRPDTDQPLVVRLLESEGGPFNATGSMRPAFTTRSKDWDSRTRDLAPDALRQLHAEREGERLALLAWVNNGADRGAYDRDDFQLSAELAGQPITANMLAGPLRVKVRTLLTERCADCHSATGRDEHARLRPLDSYELLQTHVAVIGSTRMPIAKLAQTTHVHLLGLALLYAATGILFCFTGAPRTARVLIAPLPLVAQGIDIGCWWLSRWDAGFTWGVIVGSALAGIGLAIHVSVGLWELSGVARHCGAPSREVE
jgi:hypothetical protein